MCDLQYIVFTMYVMHYLLVVAIIYHLLYNTEEEIIENLKRDYDKSNLTSETDGDIFIYPTFLLPPDRIMIVQFRTLYFKAQRSVRLFKPQQILKKDG